MAILTHGFPVSVSGLQVGHHTKQHLHGWILGMQTSVLTILQQVLSLPFWTTPPLKKMEIVSYQDPAEWICCAYQAGLEFAAILLCLFPECWDYSHAHHFQLVRQLRKKSACCHAWHPGFRLEDPVTPQSYSLSTTHVFLCIHCVCIL